MPDSPTPETLAWLRQSAAVDGAAYSQVLLHLLERLEALEQRPIPGAVELAAPTPEAAPVATDKELRSVYSGGTWGGHGPALRDVYDLGRQHGAGETRQAAAQPAPVTTGEQWDVLANRLWDQYATTGPGGNQFMLVGDFGTALELARQHGAAPPAPVPVVVPVAVAKRLPAEGDCDAEGRCWLFSKVESEWRLLNVANPGVPHLKYCFSHWLPAHAIPLPHAGEVEGPNA
jgi:hypothetical protein